MANRDRKCPDFFVCRARAGKSERQSGIARRATDMDEVLVIVFEQPLKCRDAATGSEQSDIAPICVRIRITSRGSRPNECW